MTCEKWLPIPVAPKYEINQRGDVRNIKTGRTLKPIIRGGRTDDKHFYLYHITNTNGAPRSFPQSSLLWLTHGIIPKRKNHSRLFVPVIVSRGGERYYFDSSRQAAQFIARREHYSAMTVAIRLSKRQKEIYGWKINYQR